MFHIRGLKTLLSLFYFRVEEKFAGGKFREIPFGVDIIFAGGKFRAKSKFAKIYSTRKIGVIQYSAFFSTRNTPKKRYILSEKRESGMALKKRAFTPESGTVDTYVSGANINDDSRSNASG